jgi:hypothetical protein
MARSQFKQTFVAISVANRRKQVPYPADMSELPPFVDWFPLAIREQPFEDVEEKQLLSYFSMPPAPTAVSYKSCTAYGNHWRTMSLSRLVDCDGSDYATFDSGMACSFKQLLVNNKGEMVEKSMVYVGVLTEILKLDYGPLPNPILLFKGKWVDSKTQPRERATIRHDESGLLQANFSHELSAQMKMDYVLPSQVQQVFLYPNFAGAKWRTVLHKEARSRPVYSDIEDVEYTVPVDANCRLHIQLAHASRITPMLPPAIERTEEPGQQQKRKRS